MSKFRFEYSAAEPVYGTLDITADTEQEGELLAREELNESFPEYFDITIDGAQLLND